LRGKHALQRARFYAHPELLLLPPFHITCYARSRLPIMRVARGEVSSVLYRALESAVLGTCRFSVQARLSCWVEACGAGDVLDALDPRDPNSRYRVNSAVAFDCVESESD
jgi:hypothetical protein